MPRPSNTEARRKEIVEALQEVMAERGYEQASVNRIAQNVSVGTRPFQVSFSRAFAYVRSLGTERVSFPLMR